MTLDITTLCHQARREAVLRVLARKASTMSLEQLLALLEKRGRYRTTLRSLTSGELQLARDERLPQIQRLIASRPDRPFKTRELCQRFGMPRWTAQAIMLELVALEIVERRGSTYTVHYFIKRSTIRAGGRRHVPDPHDDA